MLSRDEKPQASTTLVRPLTVINERNKALGGSVIQMVIFKVNTNHLLAGKVLTLYTQICTLRKLAFHVPVRDPYTTQYSILYMMFDSQNKIICYIYLNPGFSC